MSKMTKEEEMQWYEMSKKHWRSWGSWFSWGSPVGLSIFFLSTAVTIWIIAGILANSRKRGRLSGLVLIGISFIMYGDIRQYTVLLS